MKFDNTWTGNWEGAFRGMRHAMKSHDRADSSFDYTVGPYHPGNGYQVLPGGRKAIKIGPNDQRLAKNLILASKGGKAKAEGDRLTLEKQDGNNAHRKYLRQIMVSVDISAPLYWWSEADTYKVGTTANSESTMHKLTSEEITPKNFELQDFTDDSAQDFIDTVIDKLEEIRGKDIPEIEKLVQMKEILPTSWIQKRHWTGNYEVLRTMYHQRKGHRLKQWNTDFKEWVESLPYAEELIVE